MFSQQTAPNIKNKESILSCFTAFREKWFCMKSHSLCHHEFFLLMSRLWGPPVALCITPALYPRWALTYEHSHAPNPHTVRKRLPSKLIFSSGFRQRQWLHIKLRASSYPLRLSILGEFSFLSGQPVKCVIGGKLNASASSVLRGYEERQTT